MINEQTSGIYAVAPTPFLEDGAVDFHSLDRLIDYYEAAGVNGLTILGVLGEAQKLNHQESLEVLRRVLQRTRLPVVVGANAPGLAQTAQLAREAMDAGAAGLMIGPAPHLRADAQILSYFLQIAEAVGPETPFALQDYPLALGVQIPVNVIRDIVQSVPGCVMLKHEDWPGLEKLSALRDLEARGDMRRISVLIGNGGLFLDFELDRGADGAMTGYAFPEMLTRVLAFAQRGDRDAAHDLYDAHLPLLRYEHQPGAGLAVRKYLFKQRGIFASDKLRAPGAALSAIARGEVDYLVSRVQARDPDLIF